MCQRECQIPSKGPLLRNRMKQVWANTFQYIFSWTSKRPFWASTLLYPVSLIFGCWDRVQGGDPLYGPVKCMLGHRGQIWPIWTRFFAKRPYQYGFGEWLFSAGLTFTFLGAKIGHFWGVWPNVRIEEQMSELRRRAEIVMQSLALYICNDQWPSK